MGTMCTLYLLVVYFKDMNESLVESNLPFDSDRDFLTVSEISRNKLIITEISHSDIRYSPLGCILC